MKRGFTYIDDITEGITKALNHIPTANSAWLSENPDPATSCAPYKIYNIGNNEPVELLYLIEVLEENLGIKAKRNMVVMQPGDVPETYADIDDLVKDTGFKPKTPIEDGIKYFVDWYKSYYSV